MNILVTGGLGYIGSHTVIEVAPVCSKIHIIDNLVNSSATVLDSLKTILPSTELVLHQGDLRDLNFLSQVFSNKIDAVIHFAARKNVGESMEIPLEYYHSNVAGTINLLLAMKKANVKKVIFSSSSCVYGDEGGIYSESNPSLPVNVYGRTKVICEQMINDYSKTDPDFQAIILRYFNPVGAHASGLIGDDPKGTYLNLVPLIQKVAIGEVTKLLIFGNDYASEDGTAIRDYIHVVDVAKGHVSALENLQAGVEVYNLGTGRGFTVLQILKANERVIGKEINYEVVGRRPGDVNTLQSVPTKANTKLNWYAQISLEQMCRDSWNFLTKKIAKSDNLKILVKV